MNILLRDRRFAPLFAAAILGALNDNMIKAAIIVFAALTVPVEEAASVGLMAGGLLMLPFVLFSGIAGTLADKFEKAAVIRATKVSEMVLAGIATGVFLTESLTMMLGMVFLMGAQSAIFGPLKLGWLPERLKATELMRANAWLESGTFLAILAGTVAGGLLSGGASLVWIGIMAVFIAAVGFAASLALPTGSPAAPDLPLKMNPIAGNLHILRDMFSDRIIGRAALLITWFWAAGSVYLSSLPAFLRAKVGADETVITLVMALFALGIGTGAFVANKSLKGQIGLTTLTPAAAGIAISSIALWLGLGSLEAPSGDAFVFASLPGAIVAASLFGVAFGGGAFAVPLKALIQSRSPKDKRARTVAALNITTSVGIAVASGLVALAVGFGLDVGSIFLGVALSAVLAFMATIICFPREALQGAIRTLLKTWFRVEITGEEHLSYEGPVIFVANHVSLLDGPLLFALIRRRCSIAMNTEWTQRRGLRWLSSLVPVAPIDPQRPMAAKTLAQRVQGGEACLIFPEGRVSTHGGLMKVYPGTAWLVDASAAPVVNITIEGLEVSPGARAKAGFRRRLFPKVKIYVDAPQALKVGDEIKGRARREQATLALQDILEDGRRRMLEKDPSVPHAFARAEKTFGSKDIVIRDPLGNALTRRKIAVGGAVFSDLLREKTSQKETVGVLLPGVASVAVVLMGLWRSGRVPAMLNPTLGEAPALSALKTAEIKTVLSSRDFVAKAGIEPMINAFNDAGVRIIWTEDLKAEATLANKVKALWSARRATDVDITPEMPAAILFTSGTEGAPKGVVLSHANLIANIAQLRARTDVNPSDRVMTALPLFHSFGLTAGILMPLVAGAKVAIYPSPLHYRVIPEVAYSEQATLIFGTDTFLAGWGRRASSYDFSSLRAAIAGAEPVKDSTRRMWSERFGVRILEGYGATEAAPVLALNTPMAQQAGTVGRMLSGIETRLEKIPGIEGFRLWVRGPNIMSGYLLADQPGILQPPVEGWYDTGDVINVCNAGFVSICGRVKRFAKVGGEMVSLGAVEALAARTWPDVPTAAISLPDPRKGEKVVLIAESADCRREDIQKIARQEGVAEISLPSEVIFLDHIPVLASGKTDFPSLTAMITTAKMEAA
jgi:acyl-[acyl-carrier-protein]-phospholipid O-acyltransferase / long-chain-fatty-acid--[acyl-carrier-protein] ligase